MNEPLHQDVKIAIDQVIGQRLSGIESTLDEVKTLLTRMVLVEERMATYKADNADLRKSLDALYDRMRALEKDAAVNDAKDAGQAAVARARMASTERTLWAILSGALALGIAIFEGHGK